MRRSRGRWKRGGEGLDRLAPVVFVCVEVICGHRWRTEITYRRSGVSDGCVAAVPLTDVIHAGWLYNRVRSCERGRGKGPIQLRIATASAKRMDQRVSTDCSSSGG
ncbi:hypothetical protein ABL78_8150 [Leptomonas seymouri]|uniref:Uncharacterized protein n=1 Tax=Leptomonas seymouri TaxID=5684 RepID=A0A0N0P2D8_LEPSE|nr:hypothetical protein ABL78_8150 [Leptomonas seymouri]|eukprot:KPI82836.1 hypothetical protein ABL78_8150 [Leptomonas seymouri]